MSWTRRRWLAAFAAATAAFVLRGRRAEAAPPARPSPKKGRPAERVEYRTRWIGHF